MNRLPPKSDFPADAPAKRRPRPTPKGRQVDSQARAAIADLLAGQDLRRDLLIEHLHRIQDRFGHLSAAHLAALAEAMRLSMAEVWEVASFYHHFDLVKEGDAPPPATTIRVCDSLSCAMAGAEALLAALTDAIDPAQVRVVRQPCIGRCAQAPAVTIGWSPVANATPERVLMALREGAPAQLATPAIGFDAYRANGGYRLLAAVRDGSRGMDDIIATLSDAGLKGLGGAGFPAGKKWQIVRGYPGPRLMSVNGDEGEPGTFKDRHHLERDPHRFLEGALIAAHAVEAERVYLYLRDEYPGVIAILREAVAAVEAAGVVPPGFLEIRRGAGAYICGEESAMLESIEGKRGLPRHRPPYIAERGLFGRPTLNHNIETLFWVRDILENGADWFGSHGLGGAKGLRSWSVSGRVRQPGVIVAPAGITANELVERAGGMLDGHAFAAYLPGGASGGILPASLSDVPLDFGTLAEHGCFVGSHALVILSDRDDVRDVARNLIAFFAHESCGQCTPCRAGTQKALALMQAEHWDEDLLEELCTVMADASICGLGQAAPNPIRSALRLIAETRP